jgi:predicted metal-dependent peptidase
MITLNEKIHPKIIESIKYMLLSCRLSFWGEFALFIKYIEDKNIKTAGVRFNGISMEYLFSPEFIDSLKLEEVNGLMVHEEFHLLSNHNQRAKRGNYDPYKSNVIMDMIINHGIKEMQLKDVVLPMQDKIFFIPEEYKGKQIFEELYAWMEEQKQKRDEKNKQKNKGKNQNSGSNQSNQPQNSDGSGDQEGENGENNGQGGHDKGLSDQLNKGLDAFEDAEGYGYDDHLTDENAPDGLKEQIIRDIKNGLKARGVLPAGIENMLDRIFPSKKNYVKKISIAVSNIKGNKRTETITKPNRRNILGLKGKKTISNTLNCILDVSGSMDGYLEKVLSCIFINDYKINLIQCDAKVQKHEVISSKSQLQKMKIKGYGGTILQPAIDYCHKDKKINKLPIIILTDGYTDSLNFKDTKGLVITCGVNPTVSGSRVEVINIEK